MTGTSPPSGITLWLEKGEEAWGSAAKQQASHSASWLWTQCDLLSPQLLCKSSVVKDCPSDCGPGALSLGCPDRRVTTPRTISNTVVLPAYTKGSVQELTCRGEESELRHVRKWTNAKSGANASAVTFPPQSWEHMLLGVLAASLVSSGGKTQSLRGTWALETSRPAWVT